MITQCPYCSPTTAGEHNYNCPNHTPYGITPDYGDHLARGVLNQATIISELRQQIADLKAENRKLREALDEIWRKSGTAGIMLKRAGNPCAEGFGESAQIAKKALNRKEQP